MNFWQSLTGRLFKLVFGSYVILAIMVTAIQLALEYSSVHQRIAHDLVSLGQSFRDSISGAMWELDRSLIKTMAQGIAQSSIVTGVKITTENDENMAIVGKTPTVSSVDSASLFAAFQFHVSHLERQTPKGVRHLGQLTIYADRSVVLERITYSFFVILINSLVETIGLWVIFYLVISKALATPLSRLTEVVSQLEFAAESRDLIVLDYPHLDELGRLVNAMRTMQGRLAASRKQLDLVNHHLEETVHERTRNFKEAIAFNDKILHDSPLPMGVYAASGQCILANQSYAQMVGATRDDLLAQNFHQIVAWQTSGLLDDCLTALSVHSPQHREVHVVSSFGKKVWLETRILPTLLNGEDHLLIQFVDLTERKQAEQKLRHAMETAAAASHAKSAFLANMSHEIRTPMNAILGLTSLVLDTRLNSIQKDYLRKIDGASKALLCILNDILDYSKIESNHMDIESIPFSLEDVLSNVRDLFSAHIEEKRLKLSYDIAPEVAREMIGDPLRLTQVVNNLVGNAVKFTEKGDIRVRVRNLSSMGGHDLLAFQISDTGIGIASEQINLLFHPFTQADGSITRRYGGTGLGLAICHRLVALMGGQIVVESTLGEGTTFTFTIRVKHANLSARLPKKEDPPPQSLETRFSHSHILLVEDHPVNQQVAREFLTRLGVRVSTANHGREALAAVQRQNFDAVLMDLHMPVMDGIEASMRIRQLSDLAGLPIIAVTAAVMDEDRARCFNAGINDFISKPIDPMELAVTLGRWLPHKKVTLSPVRNEETDDWHLPESCPGFDLKGALERFSHNHRQLGKMLVSWQTELATIDQELSLLLTADNAAGAREIVHRVKGVAANFGAIVLADAAEELERSLKNGLSPNLLRNRFSEALTTIRATLSDLSSLESTALHTVSRGPACDDARGLLQLIHDLVPLVQEYAFIPEKMIEHLHGYANHPDWGIDIQYLLRQLDNLDFESASTGMDSLIRRLT